MLTPISNPCKFNPFKKYVRETNNNISAIFNAHAYDSCINTYHRENPNY